MHILNSLFHPLCKGRRHKHWEASCWSIRRCGVFLFLHHLLYYMSTTTSNNLCQKVHFVNVYILGPAVCLIKCPFSCLYTRSRFVCKKVSILCLYISYNNLHKKSSYSCQYTRSKMLH